MYLARLQEALEADFPGLLHFLGRKRFSDLATGYLDRHPSRSHTLNRLGDRLPEYIRSSPGMVRQDFLYELARFELLMSRLFDAEESPALTPEAIAAVPPESWETARLKPVAALSVQALRYPVGAYLEAVRQRQASARHPAQEPLGGGLSTPIRAPLAGSVRPAFRLLHALVSNVPLGEALNGVLRGGRQPVGEVQLFSWFRGWVTEGLFQAVELEDPQ